MKQLFIASIVIICGLVYAQEPITIPAQPQQLNQATTPDPIDQTTELVLQSIPQLLNSFIKIVQDPNNSGNVAQQISSIVASIAAITSSAIKRDKLEQALYDIIVTKALIVRSISQ